MSYIYLANRAKVVTATAGTGTINLGAATSAAFRTFAEEASAGNIVDGESCFYLIEDGTDYEYGLGTYTAGSPDTLSRDTVLGSSNSGSKINLSGAAVVGTFPPAAYLPRLDSDLQLTLPNQSFFAAYNSSQDNNQTGNGADPTVDFDTELHDRAGDFATDTYTARSSGMHFLFAHVRVTGIVSGITSGRLKIVTSNGTFYRDQKNPFACADNSGVCSFQGGGLFYMDAGDTAHITVQLSNNGGGDVADIEGSGASDVLTDFNGGFAG